MKKTSSIRTSLAMLVGIAGLMSGCTGVGGSLNRPLFSTQPPLDYDDPVLATEEAVLQCRKGYEGKEGQPTLWAGLETCEKSSFVYWTIDHSLDKSTIDGVIQQNHALLAQAQQGRLSAEEAWLQFMLAMEKAAVERSAPERTSYAVEYDQAETQQQQACARRYSGHEAPNPHYRALCHNIAYLTWARRMGGYRVSDLTPVLDANLANAQDEQDGHYDMKKSLDRLQQAHSEVTQRVGQQGIVHYTGESSVLRTWVQ
ncbi:hypothetical protein [Saccharibacter sp. EH60]|uniref:hypothetical protein n=2 Tax=Saccharibacter TaxID=231052 RepID=UPI001F1F81FF|nr:hypothetical protein [Saccharibacter sp. EH60]